MNRLNRVGTHPASELNRGAMTYLEPLDLAARIQGFIADEVDRLLNTPLNQYLRGTFGHPLPPKPKHRRFYSALQ